MIGNVPQPSSSLGTERWDVLGAVPEVFSLVIDTAHLPPEVAACLIGGHLGFAACGKISWPETLRREARRELGRSYIRHRTPVVQFSRQPWCARLAVGQPQARPEEKRYDDTNKY
jgi:hypothetical protein